MDARVQYYRKDVYDAHGLKPAATWDDLIHVSETLTGDNHYGLAVPGQGDPAQRTFSDLLWQAGGEWVDESNKPSFNAAPGVEALTFYRDLIQKYKVTPPDAVGLTNFVSQSGVDWGAMSAAGVLMVIPTLIFVWFAQGLLVKGLVTGAVRG